MHCKHCKQDVQYVRRKDNWIVCGECRGLTRVAEIIDWYGDSCRVTCPFCNKTHYHFMDEKAVTPHCQPGQDYYLWKTDKTKEITKLDWIKPAGP